jgi:hypothetical protein
LRLKDLPARLEDGLAGPQGPSPPAGCLLRHLQLGRKRHLAFAVLFRAQPRSPRRRFPQLASQALGFGTGLGVLQRDYCLSGTDNVTVRDQNFPDDAALEVLNRLATRIGFDGAVGNRGAFQGGA